MASSFTYQMVLQALLCHLWRCRDQHIPTTAALFPEGYLIAYKDLIAFGSLPLVPIQMGHFLSEVAFHCECNDWPPLHALVVNAQHQRPGRGYHVTRSSSLDSTGWQHNDVAKCLACTELPRVAGPISRRPAPQRVSARQIR